MQQMNTYRITTRIASIVLLTVFIFAASQPVRSYSLYKNTGSAYQDHLENITVNFTPDWQKDMVAAKILIGSAWNIFFKSVRIPEAPNIIVPGVHLLIPTTNAP
jgi:hypothetical protein